MADPAVHVFGGRIYIYPSHDRDSGAAENDNGDHFEMQDYHVNFGTAMSLRKTASTTCTSPSRTKTTSSISA
jgi:hypothetical protein